MCTSAELRPALLYILVVYVVPFLLLCVLLAVLSTVRLSRRLGASRTLAAWSLIPGVGPAVFLWAVAHQKLLEDSVGSNDQSEKRSGINLQSLSLKARSAM